MFIVQCNGCEAMTLSGFRLLYVLTLLLSLPLGIKSAGENAGSQVIKSFWQSGAKSISFTSPYSLSK